MENKGLSQFVQTEKQQDIEEVILKIGWISLSSLIVILVIM
jgi:hypothetical protein